MSGVFEVFRDNIIPIALIAAIGFIIRRRLAVDKKMLSTVSFYVLGPCLVFSSLVKSEIGGQELWQMVLFSIETMVLTGVVGLLAARLLRLSRIDTAALLLVVVFVNCGNYGLTLNQLRYGDDGLSRAVIYFAVSSCAIYTIGVMIASMGTLSIRESLQRMVRFPALYAVILALIIFFSDLSVPAPLMRTVEIVGDGAIPVMLLVLGMQLADLDSWEGLRLAVPASLLRMVLGPALALLVAGWTGLSGLNRSVSILEASMPTAVLTTILATEFDLRPRAVTTTVVLTTILSIITLPVLISLFNL